MNHADHRSMNMAGLFTLSLRWAIGWTYFSAFWRRLILDNKLIPEEAGYVGEKFNHFLPNALGIQPIIEYLVSHPEALQQAMVVFTIVEAIVGLFLMLGWFTRLMSVGVFLLALGILLGSGWLGTTCLDEWQIGVLGVASGFVLFLTGSGPFSIDHYLAKRGPQASSNAWWSVLRSARLPVKNVKPLVLVGSLFIFGLTLFTNQYFHGGVWGKLHNKSVRPKVEISHVRQADSLLSLRLYRVEGADVYGSFLIGIHILDAEGKVLQSLGQEELAQFPQESIHNHYVAKIKPGKYSLVLPLGAKADVTLPLHERARQEARFVKLVDISGVEWQASIE